MSFEKHAHNLIRSLNSLMLLQNILNCTALPPLAQIETLLLHQLPPLGNAHMHLHLCMRDGVVAQGR